MQQFNIKKGALHAPFCCFGFVLFCFLFFVFLLFPFKILCPLTFRHPATPLKRYHHNALMKKETPIF